MRTEWSVAYRKKGTGTILKDTKTPFTIVKNSIRLWAADPFLIEENGETYIFAELYDRLIGRGTIGYCKYTEKGFTSWKSIIKEKWHLSFPNIFRYNGEIYIMPESFQSNQLYLYKAIKFPDVWEKCKVIYDGKALVDSVFFSRNEKNFIFTYEIKPNDKWLLYMGEIDKDGKLSLNSKPISDDEEVARPGGNFFKFEGKTIRVSQDCLHSYGDKLVFSAVNSEVSDGYSENIIKKISNNDIKISDNTDIFGIHTYNSNENFEVIDIKTKRSFIPFVLFLPLKAVKKIMRRLRRK